MSQDKNEATGRSEEGGCREVISLCARRRLQEIEAKTCELLEDLEGLHRVAVGVHNQVIDSAEVSVLNEFCRTTGLYFDDLDAELQCSVIVPATLYGHSGGKIFGKEPLQKEIARHLETDGERELFRKLNEKPPAIWQYRPRPGEVFDEVVALAGEGERQHIEVVGAIVRHGTLSRKAAAYIGWLIEREGLHYLVFAYALSEAQQKAVRFLLAAQDEKIEEPAIWSRLELPLLHRILDPLGYGRRVPEAKEAHQEGLAIRRPASRRGLLLQIRRTLWRHFAEPSRGLTVHAHLAALYDEPEAFEAFLDELDEIQRAVTIRFGGLPADEAPIEATEILAPFGFGEHGALLRPEVDQLSARLLLTGATILETAGLSMKSTLGEVRRFVMECYDHPIASHLHCALLTFQTEQNLIATYNGFCEEEGPGLEGLAKRSPVLPNIRTLFDPRFMAHSLADLDLDEEDRNVLNEGLHAWGTDLVGFTLDDIPSDERWLLELPSVGLRTCNAIREALIRLGMKWRHR